LANKEIHHATLSYKSFIATGSQPSAAESQVRRAPADAPTPFVIYADPWMNFTHLLLLTVQRGDSADLFRELKSKYEGLYGNETNFVQLVEDIGLEFFNIPKPRKQGNLMQDLMANLFSGGGGAGLPQLGAPTASKSGEDLD
jgi:hypothetical protein